MTDILKHILMDVNNETSDILSDFLDSMWNKIRVQKKLVSVNIIINMKQKKAIQVVVENSVI